MPSIIPFRPSDPLQTITVTLDQVTYVLRARWNTYEAAWYLDAWESDGTTPIAFGLKLVLGVKLGQSTPHSLFTAGLFVIDTSNTATDAGLDDFGTRVLLVHMTAGDAILSATVN